MDANYFFIDGSALTAQIRQLQRAKPRYQNRKLCPREFIDHFMNSIKDLHNGSYKRAVFYFPKGDESNVNEYLRNLEHRKPGEVRDIHFKFCGHKLKKSAEFTKFVEEGVPPKFQGRFSKSEKGIDIEICCDALKLASFSRLERLFLLTNDSDMVPLCNTLKDFGANISIIHLHDFTEPNIELLKSSDSFDTINEKFLNKIFHPQISIDKDVEPLNLESIKTTPEEPEKPEAPPSDLNINNPQIENGA